MPAAKMTFSGVLSAVLCLLMAGCIGDDPSLPSTGKLHVTVLDQNNSPVTGAVVEVRTPADVFHAEKPTDAQGVAVFYLGLGDWRVRILTPEEYEMPAGAINPQTITLRSSEPLSYDFTLHQKNADVLAGTVNLGWEWAAFRGCGQPQSWWIASEADVGRLVSGWRAASLRGAHEVWVVARGLVRGPGRYGHLSAYEREVHFSAVQEVREYRASDCPEREVSVAPRSTMIAPGDTLRMDLAVYDAGGNRINPVDIVWTSTNPTVATVTNGLVSARERGLARIIGNRGAIADTALIEVQWPWYMTGFASIQGTVRNADGSRAVNVPLYATCVDSWGVTPSSDAFGNFTVLFESPMLGAGLLTDARTQACQVRTSVPNDTIPGVAFVAGVFSRPGVAAPTVQVEVVRRRRTATLQLQTESRTLIPGSSAQVNAMRGGVAEQVKYRSLLPEVASVDSMGRVTARTPGTTTIIATSHADSTVMGWLDLYVRRFW